MHVKVFKEFSPSERTTHTRKREEVRGEVEEADGQRRAAAWSGEQKK